MGNRYTICNCVELIRTNGRFEYNYYKNSKIQGSDDYYTEKDIQSKKTQQETNSDLFISLPSLAEICQRLDLDSVVTSTRSRGQWRESLSQARLSARCSHVAFRRGNQRATRGYRFSPLPKGQAWGLWEISARAARVSASSRARTPLKGASSRQMEGIFSQLTPNLQDKWWRDHRDSRDKESSAGAVKDKRALGVGPRTKSYGLCTNRKRKPVLFSIVHEHRNDIAAPPIWFKYMKQSRVCSEGSSDKLITENKPRECELNTLVHHYRNGSAFSRIWAMDREISIVSSNVSNTSPVTNKSSHCRSKDLVRHLPNDPLLPLILFKDEKNNPTNIVQTSTTVPTQNMTLSRESSLTARQYPNSFYGASLSHKTKRKNSIKYESLGERLRFLHQTRASPFVLNDMKPAHSGNIEQVRGISIYTNETGGEEKMSYPHDERKDYPSNNPEKSVYHKSENVMSEKSMFVADPLNIDTSEIVDDDLLKRSPGSTDSEQTFDYATIGPPRRRLLSLEENHAEDTPDCRTLNSQQDTVQNSLSGEGSKLQTYATAEDQIHQGQFDFKPEGNEQTASARKEQDTKAKEQTRQKRRPTSKKASSCTTTEKSERKHHVLSRHPRHVHYDTQDAEDDGVRLKAAKAVYLSGAEVLRFIPRDPSKRYALPNVNFTVELWAKPEGGQHLPVTIVGMADVCQGSVSGGVWSVRLTSQSVNGRTDIRYSFSLSTEASSTLADATGPTGYTPGHWTHIAAVYDGTRMKLYVDGAQVAVNLGRKGKVFPVPLAHCKELQIGGSVSSKNRFRGTLSDLRVWKDVLSQEEIVNSQKYPQRRPRPAKESFVIEDFLNLDEWELIRGHAVRKVALYRSSRITQGHHHHHPIPVPPCGETVCDNPEVVKHYVDHEPLRNFKVVRYRIVNLMNDDGASPIVSNGQILRQHTALNAAFRRYNIGFHLDVTSIRNTLLRQKLVMFGCAASLVGNGVCDIECNQTRTGNDGGDCDMYHVTCNASNVGNGVCDFECNKAYHGWDGGDCCLPGEKAHYTCYDPRSPHRGYLSIEELKDVVQLPSVDHLHVMFASWNTDHLIGIATFPWDKHVFGVRGGTVVQPQTFGVSGQTDSLVHEIGHNLGLWHVHHGVSELPCGDPCTEVEASMEHGDLCSDTAPTPQNVHCRDPGVAPDVCDRYRLYTDTPFSNFMSYAGGLKLLFSLILTFYM
ncbi:uncharacterized protein LOC106011109 isoform X2 [Aplysia californica]|nr:uncharacterized protein LOC106011109 isoform X2 [Aplysia californica]